MPLNAPLRSIFVTGTDSSVGKSVITEGLAYVLAACGIRSSIMNPHTAATKKKAESDYGDLAAALHDGLPADVDPGETQAVLMDGERIVAHIAGAEPSFERALAGYRKLASENDVLLIDCVGGIMGQLDEDHLVADLIAAMGLDALIVCGRKKGEARRAAMAVDACAEYGIGVAGIVANAHVDTRYPWARLRKELARSTNVRVIGTMPHLTYPDNDIVASKLHDEIDLDALFEFGWGVGGFGARFRGRQKPLPRDK